MVSNFEKDPGLKNEKAPKKQPDPARVARHLGAVATKKTVQKPGK
jgi:hypothetical protein